VKAQVERPVRKKKPAEKGSTTAAVAADDALDKVAEIVRSLEQDYDPLWGSIVKQTMRRVHPGFNEAQHGYRSFSDLLHAAEDQKLIVLEYDESRGNYKVRLA